jgi:glutathione S-transferase
MSDALIFHTNPMSRGRIVRWMLEEVGRPYETRLVEYGAAMKSPGFRAINPMGKVPVLEHRGQFVTESAAICAYLADACPEAGLAPPADSRAAYYRWLFFAAGPVEAATTNHALGVEVPVERKGMVGYGSIATITRVLAEAVSGPGYIAGDAFSAADVYAGSQIAWGVQFGTLEKRPEFLAYIARITGRDAYLRAKAMDDALMPPRADAPRAD